MPLLLNVVSYKNAPTTFIMIDCTTIISQNLYVEKIEKYDRIEGTEGYPSGRRGLIANELVWGNLERGFKSLTLRQINISFAHPGVF